MPTAPGPLDGRTALVTGAGAGIGRAAARALARSGAKVALLDLDPERVEAVRNEIMRDGGEALTLAADVSESAAVDAAIDRIHSAWGHLDVLVANAGINGLWAPLEEITPEEWDRTMNINLRGTYLTVRASLPLLKVRGGSVVVVSSVNGTRLFSNTGATAYACSKAGQRVLAHMLALEFGPYGIRINTICPGTIETQIDENTDRDDLHRIGTRVEFPEGQIPLTGGRPGTADQVAQLILFLASDASSHITGTDVFIDGGQSLLQG